MSEDGTCDVIRKAQEIFENAVEFNDEEKIAYVRKQCEGNDELLSHCLELLENEPSLSNYFELLYGKSGAGNNGIGSSPLFVDQNVGPYKIQGKLGRGGMADVYLAKRTDGVHEGEVALKIVQEQNDKESLIRRFNSERKILANLKHPNIAQLLDGGSTDDGLPYFVMENVQGKRIDIYCNEKKLTINERLRIFIKVCSAVTLAHQNLVIHRDIKPGNILVDAYGEPKLLDFGLAKIIDPNMQQDLTLTGVAMTPSYASPEQAAGEVLTTASDIYSLGVLLYELLVGHRPYQITKNIKSEFERIKSDPTLIPPSQAVLNKTDFSGNALSRQGKSLAKKISRRLQGDIDTIVLKLLRREPDRRYASVQALVDDIERYLDNRPVLASKDSLFYRTNRFFRRHYTLISVVIVGLLLLAFAVGFQQVRVINERDIAELQRDIAERERDIAKKQRDFALTERNKFQQVQEFMVGLFDISDPGLARGNDITAREILDQGVADIRDALMNQPEAKSELLDTMGVVFSKLGIYERSLELLSESLELRREGLAEEGILIVESLNHLGDLYLLMADFDKADASYREALQINSDKNEDDVNASLADSWHGLGVVENKKANFQSATKAFKTALDIRERLFENEHPKLADSYDALGEVHSSLGEYDDAVKYFKKSLNIRLGVFGENHPDVTMSYGLLAHTYDQKADYQKSADYSYKVLDIRSKLYSENHPEVAYAHELLGKSYSDAAKYDEALEHYEKAIEIGVKALRKNHPSMARIYSNLAIILTDTGKVDKAIEYCKKALEIRLENFGPTHPSVSSSYNNIATNYAEIKEYEQAVYYYKKSLEIKEKTLGVSHPSVALTHGNLASAYIDAERYEEGIQASLKAIEIYEQLPQKGNMYRAMFNNNLGEAYNGTGEYELGIKYLEISLAFAIEIFGEGHPAPAYPYHGLGDAYLGLAKYSKSLEYYDKAYQIKKEKLGDDHHRTIEELEYVNKVKTIIAN